ncbi:SDR family oxidoreductase [Lysobacter yananisis]|uniref:SDR family oxidoreductase n=1 Tax=Lysobacter yananisis TaxID=1003114 RepID=A0ABY9P643_9GAMM|nr:SDR family NAD(P)-dependent oxidoreductase [Lysobacter yananisis]WMT02538.1 SDR family oxidoreductase [Lysobacter yananisis]
MDIAVIGIACRFPGADDHHAYWRNLAAREASIRVVPGDRWDWTAYWGDPRVEANKSLSKWGGFIERVDAFDHRFFGLLPKVVQTMDPQQRIMLELSWACLEDAGIAPSSLRGRKVGVIVGVFNHDYKELQERGESEIEAHHSTGTATAVIANRVSHYFDLRGPSIPVDTACSSSLNAIHSAIQAIEYGDCEMALAGGINLLLTPTRHISFSKMGMLSPTGTCKTFDERADGYVRGEGAALLLLKPLDKALADGDSVYGVIKGSAVNHCGDTYTLTYPSPRAQAEVIVAAHERAGIPVNSVGYVEAHGTGTPKGDPIEFEGLATAFRTLAERQQVELDVGYCGLGSVKTNIGHLEASAGVAGAIKVMMAFRHRQLPGLHDFATLNPRISIDGTPFYMLDATREWPRLGDAPLRAGVSSFGFGGTNAHLVLEEPPQAPARKPSKAKPLAWPMGLSAKTPQALLQRQRDLLAWLDDAGATAEAADISATLLAGRDHFDYRYACVAANAAQLRQALVAAVDAGERAERERAQAGDAAEPAPAQIDAALAEAAAALLLRMSGKSAPKGAQWDAAACELAAAYAQGAQLAWAGLFRGRDLRPAKLPTYPFARERFWIPQRTQAAAVRADGTLHPALHARVPSLGAPRFSARFDGREFFLADHVIGGQPVLPAVVYLEMVRAAIVEALGEPLRGARLQLRDVLWLRPLEQRDAPVSVHVDLAADADGDALAGQRLSFQIVAEDGSAVYCRGQAAWGEDAAAEAWPAAPADAGALELAAQACYERFDEAGMRYGAAHRALRSLRLGEQECVAELELPEGLDAQFGQYVLHPSLADAALQAAVAWSAGFGPEPAAAPRARVPFALDRLDLRAACTPRMRARLRRADGKIDIELSDADSGRVCALLGGLSVRPLQAEPVVAAAPAAELPALSPALAASVYRPHWSALPLPAADAVPEQLLLIGAGADVDWLQARLRADARYAATRIERLCFGASLDTDGDTVRMRAGDWDDAQAAVAALAARGASLAKVLWIAPRDGAQEPDLGAYVDAGARSAFVLAKAMLRGTKSARFVHLIADPAPRPDAQGLSGFYKTLRIEKPSYSGRAVQFDPNEWHGADLGALIAAEFAGDDSHADVRYREGRREVRDFVVADGRADAGVAAGAGAALREDGTYLITGGLGALGLIFARHLCGRYRATVYLTGRKPPNEAQQLELDALNALGGQALYLACDVSRREDVRAAVARIHADGRRLNGVLHSAGVIEDGFILRKDAESFGRVIAPKALGTWHLDEETRAEPLEVFALFSSVTGVLGNVGQCDYGFGNAFEDYFAHAREALRGRGERSGKTLSVNWPYWKDGGMRLGEKEEQMLRNSFGIVPLLNDEGLAIFEYGLAQASPQLATMPGDAARVAQVLGVVEAAPVAAAAVDSVAAGADGDDAERLRPAIARHLSQLFAAHLQIAAHFDPDRAFRDYGFDSVVMIDLVNLLEKDFGSLPKTLFFEQQTLAEMTAYFIEQHPQASRRVAGLDAPAAAPAASVAAVSAAATPVAALPARASAPVRRAAPEGRDDIAIVGISGRYPKAEDLEQFWDNLTRGLDCVVEIPSDRWDIESTWQPGPVTIGKSYSKWGGFLDRVDQFDPLFFNISPKEAEIMDPSERLFLETAALAIEDAGYTPDKLAAPQGVRENPVGVYAGVMWGDYQLYGIEGAPDTWTTPHSLYWAIANRVSHCFNFSGPSITIDTACSSSLTAIHLACAAIRNGEVAVALAGAVNLSLHFNKYHLLADMRFLSSDGRCRSFGEGGDGYVPGEGVGAVLLKPLAQAQADGDHIYGVIRGTSVNHGGKTSGFTVPNSKRQAALVQEALDHAGVDPRHISYLEAHGTGTSLGDPIEIAGLNRAFAAPAGAAQELQYCAIGSVKSNIGHLEAAAGVAGLSKVLLQMKHQTLVPSIHSDTLNPYIEFQRSPFYVQRALEPWKRPKLDVTGADGVARKVEVPRLAGISSFGAGGSNAHVIVEEYIEPLRPQDPAERGQPALIVLSARKETALQAMAGNLADHLERNPQLSLHDAAYTLQIGRVAMEHRLAVRATRVEDAVEALRAHAQQRAHAALRLGHRDNAKRAAQTPALADWLARRDLDALAGAWVDGHAVEWERLHAPGARRRLPLPTYVYQRQRYWVAHSGANAQPASGAGTGAAALHPLLDANVSTLDEQTFRKTFRPDEPFLRDHQLGSNRILPGVAYLEMALAAGRLAGGGAAVRALREVRWLKPILIGPDQVNAAPESYDIGLLPDEDGVQFELYQARGESRTVYAQGVLEYEDGEAEQAATPAAFDLDAIAARCQRLERDAIDAAFARMGFNFGPGFRVFELLHFNAEEALARLGVPAQGETQALAGYTLPPSLLDGAVRTALGIDHGLVATATTIKVPVRLRRIQALHPVGGQCYAYARKVQAPGAPAEQSHYDIDVLDGSGRVLVRLERLSIQAAPQLGLGRSAAPKSEAVVASAAPVAAKAAAPAAVVAAAPAGAASDEAMYAAIIAHLVDLLSKVTKVPADQIEPKSALENYGIDSVMILTLTERLQVTFGEVPKTLFFEYQDLHSLSEYFLDSHADTVRALVAANVPASVPASAPAAAAQPAAQAALAQLAAVEAAPAEAASGADAARLHLLLQHLLGEAARDCGADTPLAQWPLDPVNLIEALHGLRQLYDGVEDSAVYRHDSLAEWAAQLREKPAGSARASRALAAIAGASLESAGAEDAQPHPAEAAAPRPRVPGASRLMARSAALERQDIAIVGLSGRYPGARTVEDFWNNLSAGRDGISEIPLSRWDHAPHFHPDRNARGMVYSKWGGFIDDVDQFDAEFFHISPREAEILDPQERLFLQTAWECIEDGCYTRQSLREREVGVFVGVMWDHYQYLDVTDEQRRYGRPMALHSSIANRVSYFLNLSGPSLALDTMCSSSLTAIHLACQAIRNGDCQMAIAGGVNLIVHPVKYHQLAQGQFLSTDGRCRAFGDGGDGYVPGEGMGAVLLKPLKQAIEDGDQIHGVIKASAVNHGGKTNGYTVPNQVAQSQVIGKALRRAGWHPGSVDYIEAHGTGTSLGDPIEIAGLSKAFASAAQDALKQARGRDGEGAVAPQSCRIGSVKTNIGHLESAAGIAGLTKILLQMRHRSIAPSLHATPLNSNIDFAKTPFRVVQALEPWDAPGRPGVAGLPAARRAGLSSFGAGGANAHLLIEEHVAPVRAAAAAQPALFVLSADSEERLGLYIDRVVAFLERARAHGRTPDLRSLAYSSQIGREAMHERVAVVASSVAELTQALAQYRKGELPAGVHRGSLRKHNEKLEGILDEAQRDALLRSLVQAGRLPQLAKAWVSMLDVDWERYADLLYADAGGARRAPAVRRLSFPGLPFLTRRHWVQQRAAAGEGEAVERLHPLLDRNLSTLTEQRYAKRLTGKEFYLRDHVVATGEPRLILPGVAYLEMARVAGELAMGGEWTVDAIRNLIWVQPVEVKDAPEDVHVELRQNGETVEFEIVRAASRDANVEGELVYRHRDEAPADEWLDLDALRAAAVSTESLEPVYAGFHRMGFHYGPAFRVTQTRYRLADGALCRLSLPQPLREEAGEFVLHPSLFDGALRACLAIGADSREATVPIVPFALGELELRHPLTEECYAYAVETGDGAEATGLRKYRIVVTDADGRVLIKLHDFSARPLVKAEPAPARSLQYYRYEWLDAPAAAAGAALDGRNVLVLAPRAGSMQSLAQALAQSLPTARVLLAQPGEGFEALADDTFRYDPDSAAGADALIAHLAAQDLAPAAIVQVLDEAPDFAAAADSGDYAAVQRSAQSLRHLFVALERSLPGRALRCACVHRCDEDAVQPQHDAVSGYAKSLLTINHRFELFTLRSDLDDAAALAAVVAAELQAGGSQTGHEIAHWNGRRLLRALLPHQPAGADGADAALPFKPRGRYLISGGAGKLGLVVARYLAARFQARLLLTGRSAQPNEDTQRQIQALRAAGAEVQYFAADAARPGQAEAAVAQARTAWGGLDGVIHCAGVASDRAILELDDAGFAEVLAPKLDGTLALDRASAGEALDVFVTFSSVSAQLGDLGSGAYAVGNRFLDSHALWREAQRRQGKRSGKTVAIGWPLWASGGMEISGEDASLFGFSGMSALSEAEGLDAFGRLLRGDQAQVLVAVGDAAKIARTLRVHAASSEPASSEPAAPAQTAARTVAAPAALPLKAAPATVRDAAPASVAAAPAPAAGDDFARRAEALLKQRLSVVVKAGADDIGSNVSFEQLGMDSVMLMELRDSLSRDFAGLPKTVLFEHDTPARLTQYLIQQHGPALRALVGEPAATAAAPAATTPAAAPAPVAPRAERSALPVSAKRRSAMPSAQPQADDAVAIVGFAGQFPQAADLAEFWDNLQHGRDCLGAIPDERWPAAAADGARRGYARRGGFLPDVDRFDPGLFRMSLEEASKLDPQLRVLLRAAWHAVEDAAYTPQALAEQRVGVYVGAMNEDFTWIMAELQARIGRYPGPGSVISELANRLSFLMNFRGPSLTVSTACSSSLTAVHLARRAILDGECELALAGGVNLSLHPSKYLMLNDMKVLSPDGVERTFDDAANGLVPSEGVGVVMLKRLSRAQADGDRIHAVIRGSSISHAGTGAGQYLPNIRVLEETASRALAEAGVATEELGYLESHGTGTELGDPIELKALANALRRGSEADGFCAIGSKANLGHMEAASGVCSLIKVLLSMRHARLSPCARLKTVNASFDHERSPFRFPREAQAWPANARGTRLAAINSFGMGGSNAFVVLESVPQPPPSAAADASVVLLSARSEERLRAYAERLLRELREERIDAAALADLAYSSQVGRVAFDHRLAIVAADRAQLAARLVAYLETGAAAARGIHAGDARQSGGLAELLDGEAGREFVEALMQSRQWDKLGSIWTRGGEIDWAGLHAGAARRRLSFPGYPFETQVCDLYAAVGAQRPQPQPLAPMAAPESAEAEADALPQQWFQRDGATAVAASADGETEGEDGDAGEELARRYWLDYLRDLADTSFALAPSVLSARGDTNEDEGERAAAPLRSVSGRLDEELVRSLQRCTQAHRIEVETLVAAAWAILVNRYTKARCSQFGVLRSFAAPRAGEGEADAQPLRNLVPVRVCTVGRDKVGGWLAALQRTLDRKHAYAHVPIDRIEQWTGQEHLFDSVIVFDRGGPDRERAEPLASALFAAQSRVAMELAVTVDADAIELSLLYPSGSDDDAAAAVLLEHFQALLEALAENPDKNPAALAMRSKREGRETFWKTLDKVNQ